MSFILENLTLIHSVRLAELRRNLIESKQKETFNLELHRKQKKFVKLFTARDNQPFLTHFDHLLRDENLEVEVSYPKTELTEKELTEPPRDTEQANYSRLAHLSPRVAAMHSFWTAYQVELVRRNIIQPSFLAAKTGGSGTGKERIEKALAEKKKSKVRRGQSLDDCVRTILRQFGGLPEVRGKVSLFVDCKLARSWWRGYFIQQFLQAFNEHDRTTELEESVWDLLRLTSAPWDELLSYGLRKLTSINYPSVRTAFIKSLLKQQLTDLKSDERKRKCQHSIKKIGVLTANQSLGLLSSQEVFELINPLIKSA